MYLFYIAIFVNRNLLIYIICFCKYLIFICFILFLFPIFLTTILKTINLFTETLIYNEINIRIQEIHFHITSLKIKQIWTIIDTNSLESVCIPITITIKLDIILSKAIGKQPSIKIPKSRKSLSPPLNSSQPPGETSSKNKRSKSN